ncbi:MAG: hypothetical protein IJ343_03790 [Clostridia bacterium]|nr:hypothetical protein [Clostridia bacterium]
MASATVSPFVALLLALSMLFGSPSYTQQTYRYTDSAAVVEAEHAIPEFTVSITSTEGESISAGIVETTDYLPAFLFNVFEKNLLVTGNASYYSDGTTTYTVPAEELLKLVAGEMPQIPEPTEDDLNALMLLAQGVAGGISSDAFALLPMGNGMSFSLDVDQLAKDLHTAVPTALTTYAANIDPTLQKYSKALLGENLTCADIAAVWPELGLDQVATGLKGTISVLPTRDGMSFVGTLCDVSFVAKVHESGFNCSITTPDGKEYVLDTNDVLVLAKVLSEVPSGMSNAGFNVTETDDTIHVTLDLAALGTDLNRALTYAIAVNSAEIDALLNKYRTWFELIDEDFAAMLTAANLKAVFQQGAISLPALKGELTIKQDGETRTYYVDGYFANCTLNGQFHSRNDVGSFLFAVNDSYDPLYLSLDIAAPDYSTTSYSLSSNVPVLGLFNTLTLYVDDSYDSQYNLTTDTNVLRLGYSSEEQYLEAKLGPVNLSYKMDEEEVNHFELYTMDFFARLLVAENHIALDTSVFGFDYSESRNSMIIDGYFFEDFDPDYDRYEFGLHYNDETMFSAYLSDGRYENYALTVGNQYASFAYNGDTYTVTPYYGAEKQAFIVAMNGKPACSIASETSDDGTTSTFYYYEGLDMTVEPAFTIVVDTDPDQVTVPTNAIVVDPNTFAEHAEHLFD